MTDDLKERIRTLAEEHGLDPDYLEQTLLMTDIPEEMAQAMGASLDDLARFEQALSNLDKK